jgi:two-component system sporulation sensor kinase B
MLQNVFNVSYILNHIVGAYAMFASTIVYCGLFQKRTVNRLKLILLIPVIVTVAASPIWPVGQINWVLLASWAVPYIFVGTYFLYRSYHIETVPKLKRDKLIVLAAVSGPTVTVAFTNYLARCFGYNDLYTSNIFVIGLVFMFVLIVVFRDNFLGIRFKVEKDRMESAMKAVVSGTSILNHAIKNEMMKISMSAEMCKNIGLDEQQETYIDHIVASSEYLLGMTRRLLQHLNEIDVKLEEVNASDMMKRIVKLNEPLCLPNGIRLETSIPDDSLMCQMDVIHVMEVVNSLIRNSIEAIQGKGRIILGLVDNSKTVMISVADDGQGITSIDLPYVMDPFYTTKRRTMNFGLGLTHGYNIMRQHKGYMEIESTEGKGTMVKLFFPHRTNRHDSFS